jgi:hypothetical protein
MSIAREHARATQRQKDIIAIAQREGSTALPVDVGAEARLEAENG